MRHTLEDDQMTGLDRQSCGCSATNGRMSMSVAHGLPGWRQKSRLVRNGRGKYRADQPRVASLFEVAPGVRALPLHNTDLSHATLWCISSRDRLK